ncbi:MAG: hypothetical protein FJW22_03135 [Acidimicrobiia bacterium]|nr:hypothetical protein [Acidimicrobiia bacterium]
MRLACPERSRRAFALTLLAVLIASACSDVIARKYEYEEEIFLDLDGSATVYVNASVPALVALRGAQLPVDPSARLDRTVVRDIYSSSVSQVESVTTSRRAGRRYVHLRLDVPDIRKLSESAPFGWSTYRYSEGDTFEFVQEVRAAAGQDVGSVGWGGDELVAVRLHLPSVIRFHNSPTRRVERGNIVVWEQLLTERRQGAPLQIEARMEKESILFRTLTLFAAMGVLVVITFIAVIWLVKTRKPAGRHAGQP